MNLPGIRRRRSTAIQYIIQEAALIRGQGKRKQRRRVDVWFANNFSNIHKVRCQYL